MTFGIKFCIFNFNPHLSFSPLLPLSPIERKPVKYKTCKIEESKLCFDAVKIVHFFVC